MGAGAAVDLKVELEDLLGPGGVLSDPADTEAYATGWRYGKGRALLVARPASTAEVAAVMARCAARGVRVLAQGANTGLVGASVPDGGGGMVVLGTERLDRRLEVDPTDRAAVAGAGVRLSALNAALAPHGLHFPVDLGADPCVGGMVATNTGGTRLLRHGDVRRNLLGVEVVLADGTVVEALSPLRKNNAGLDWKQLFTGTTGLFGIVTAAALQVSPLPRQVAAALVAVRDGEAALALLRAMETGLGETLSAFEAVSAGALTPVLRHLPNPFGGPGDVPPYAVLVEAASSLPREALDLEDALQGAVGAHLEEGGDGILDARFGRAEAFWALRHRVSECLREEGRVLAFDIAVPRSSLAAFTEAARELVAARWPWMSVRDFGHWGDGGTHLNLVWREEEAPRPAEDWIPAVQAAVYALAVEGFRGSYSAEHGVGPHNQRFFDLFTPAPVKAAGAALRAHFDPAGLLGTARLW